MAPDKIYLTNGDREHLINFDSDVADGLVMWCEDMITDHDVEYIRKDALLEWAKARLSDVRGINYEEDNYPAGEAHAIADVIDKINSL